MTDQQPARRATRRSPTRTVPVERGRPQQIRGDVTLSPDELATAMEMARSDRLEQTLRDYAHKWRTRHA